MQVPSAKLDLMCKDVGGNMPNLLHCLMSEQYFLRN